MEEAEDFKFVFADMIILCIKIEIDQLQCVICCVLSIYDMIISHALEKQNQNGKKQQGV